MRTTITLDDDVVTTIREEMKKGDGKTFKDAVNELIRLGRYHKAKTEQTPRKPFKVRAKNLGHNPQLNFDKPSEILAMMDLEEYLEKRDRTE